MEKKNTNVLIGVGVILIIIIGVWYMKASPSTNQQLVDDESIESVEDTSEGSVNASAPAAALTYRQALEKYKDSRIQLDKDCQARPNNVTYKDGSNIMIDNRSNIARTVKVGTTFPLKAWGFKIVKIDSASGTGTWHVDCDKSQNVATILIQK